MQFSERNEDFVLPEVTSVAIDPADTLKHEQAFVKYEIEGRRNYAMVIPHCPDILINTPEIFQNYISTESFKSVNKHIGLERNKRAQAMFVGNVNGENLIQLVSNQIKTFIPSEDFSGYYNHPKYRHELVPLYKFWKGKLQELINDGAKLLFDRELNIVTFPNGKIIKLHRHEEELFELYLINIVSKLYIEKLVGQIFFENNIPGIFSYSEGYPMQVISQFSSTLQDLHNGRGRIDALKEFTSVGINPTTYSLEPIKNPIINGYTVEITAPLKNPFNLANYYLFVKDLEWMDNLPEINPTIISGVLKQYIRIEELKRRNRESSKNYSSQKPQVKFDSVKSISDLRNYIIKLFGNGDLLQFSEGDEIVNGKITSFYEIRVLIDSNVISSRGECEGKTGKTKRIAEQQAISQILKLLQQET